MTGKAPGDSGATWGSRDIQSWGMRRALQHLVDVVAIAVALVVILATLTGGNLLNPKSGVRRALHTPLRAFTASPKRKGLRA